MVAAVMRWFAWLTTARLAPPLLTHEVDAGNGILIGSGIASASGILWYNGKAYIEVVRKSAHVVGKGFGFGNEVDNTGFYHFVQPSSGIFLDVGLLVMDYTCPHWVLRSNEYKTFVIERHVFRTANSTDTRRSAWRATPSDYTIALRCVNGWCTPASCLDTTFEATVIAGSSSRSMFAYWKYDPPVFEHNLVNYGFHTAITFWAGHDKKLMRAGENGTKILIDLRKYGVKKDSYANGTMIACPPGHHYHVVLGQRLQPCACKSNCKHINCGQLEALRKLGRKNPVVLRPSCNEPDEPLKRRHNVSNGKAANIAT